MKKETFRLLFLSIHLLVSTATTAATLRAILLFPILVFLEEIRSKNGLDTGILCIHQRLHLSHPILAAQALVGRVHEDITPFLAEFRGDGPHGICLYLREVQV